MKRPIRLSSDFALPLDVVTESVAIIARKRAGKSYTARKFAEQLHQAGQQIVTLDPKGDWWGIRSSADGKRPGLPIVILGGEHGDVPLEPGSGELVAHLVAVDRVSILLDLSELRKHQVATFATAFLETLYRLKAKEAHRTPLMLLIDEADAIAPQRPQKGEERMLGAAEDIVRRGGQRGIGVTLITQRAAVLNKNVLTQASILVALVTTGAQDLDALDDWIKKHGEPERRAELMGAIASLPRGTAWWWAPGWPDEDGIFRQTRVDPIETFDSGATPKPGERRVLPKTVADVDLDAFRREMAATIERAKADDPKLLRARIAELERAVKNAAPAPAKASGKPEDRARLRQQATVITSLKRALEAAMKFIVTVSAHNFDVAGVDKAELEKAVHAAVGKAVQLVDARLEARERELVKLKDQAAKLLKAITAVADDPSVELSIEVTKNEPFTVAAPVNVRRERPRASGPGDPTLPKGERAVLTAAAQHGAAGVTREQLTILTGYKRSSRDSYIQRLRERELLEARGDRLTATDGGMAALGSDFELLPTGDALREHWMARLPEGERRLLEVLVAAYPKPVERDAISTATEYQRSSRDSYLQRLGARRLVVNEGRGLVRASEELFG